MAKQLLQYGPLVPITSWSYRFSFLEMRSFKTYSLSTVQTYSTVLLAVTVVTGSLYLLTFAPHFATPTPSLWQPPICCLFL